MASKFRINAANLLLTFPKYSVSAVQALEQCEKLLPKLEWCIVGAEKHQDGDPHLHLVLHLSERIQFKGQKGMELLGSIVGQHVTRNIFLFQ